MSSGPDVLIHDEDEDASDSEDCDGLSPGLIFDSLYCFLFSSLSCSSLSVLTLLFGTDLGVGVGLASSDLSWSACFSCTFSCTFSSKLASLIEAVEAITQDSPRAERSGVRGGFVDMTSIAYPFKEKKWSYSS